MSHDTVSFRKIHCLPLSQIGKSYRFFFQFHRNFMIYVHAVCDFRHICYQMLSAACNTGNTGNPIVNGFCNGINRYYDFCHGRLQMVGIGVKCSHSLADICGVLLVLLPAGNKRKKFF